MKFKNHYQTLGVERSASAGDIKKAYRKLAHKFHPDISSDPNGEEKFKEIAVAYAHLSNSAQRQQYDMLSQRSTRENFSSTPQPQKHQTQQSSEHAAFFSHFSHFNLADDLSNLMSIFNASGRASGRTREHFPLPGRDIEVPVTVSLEQIFQSGEVDIRLNLPEHDQRGRLRHVAHTLRITLPQGVAHGYKLRLAGKGEPGHYGAKAGDLYLTLTLQPHPLYRVDGRDLYFDLPLSASDAMRGGMVHIPTPGGKVALNIKPGTRSGQKLRLAKRGLPGTDGAVGNLYAVVIVEVAETIHTRARKLYEDVAQLSAYHARTRFHYSSDSNK